MIRANPYCRAHRRGHTRFGNRRWSESRGKVVALDPSEMGRRRARTSADRLDAFRSGFIVAVSPDQRASLSSAISGLGMLKDYPLVTIPRPR